MQHPITTISHHLHHLTILCPPSPPPLQPPPPTASAHKMGFHTAFYWGKAAQILFSGWPGSSTGMYVLAVFFVFFLAVLVECLSHCRLIKPGSNRVAACLFRTGMHAVRAGLVYMVTLAVISYNGGIFIAAIVGHAIGYLVFGSGLFWKPEGPSSLDIGIIAAKF